MDLFVVNRHEGEDNLENSQHDEKDKLDKILKKIERNKKIRAKQKSTTPNNQENELLASETITPEVHNQVPGSNEIPQPDDKPQTVEVNSEVETKTKSEKRKLEGFTVLGAENFEKKQKVKRVLPKWLSNPTVISVDLQNLETRVSDIKQLDKRLRKLLKANGISRLFPVQAAVIPWLIEKYEHADIMFPRDICVSAPTGSGKTLAFVLPIVQILQRFSVKQIRALVILPTQELAKQVFKTFKMYTERTNLDVLLVTGQKPFEVEQPQLIYESEAFGFVSKVDILVCTAGRLVDHMKLTKGFNLHYLEFLVIDEADRVLDSVQNDWLYHLEKHISVEESAKVLNLQTFLKPKPPQKLLFSATLSQDPEKLQKLSLFQPKLFTSIVEAPGADTDHDFNTDTFIGKYTTPKELTEKYIQTTMDLKPLVLFKFIEQEKLTKTLIFTHSVESAHRLTILLKTMFKDKNIHEISSHLLPKSRTELIQKFSKGEIDLLICTDSFARGIDLPSVQCVISYSAPKYLKTYIHRAGRTARAGEPGLAVTLLHLSQLQKFNLLLNQANKMNVTELKISEEDLEPLAEQYKESLENLKVAVDKEEQETLNKRLSIKKRGRPRSQRKKNQSVPSANTEIN